MTSLKPPPPFSPGTIPAEEWTRWRQRYENYRDAAGLTSKPIAQQRAILLHVIGEIGFELVTTLQIVEEGDDRTAEIILNAITEHYLPFKNTTYRRYVFFTLNQNESQSIDDFVTELKVKAKDCQFETLCDSLIRDRLICGIKDKELRERLLREPNLTLTTAIDLCRADEVSKQQVQVISKVKQEAVLPVDAISKKGYMYKAGPKQERRQQPPQNRFANRTRQPSPLAYQSKQSTSNDGCSRCLREHPPRQCPAYGKQCYKCGKTNHFAEACTNKKKQVHVHGVEEHSKRQQENVEEYLFLGYLFVDEVHEESATEWMETLKVGDCNITFKIDTGSQVNIIPEKLLNKIKERPSLTKTNKIITAYSGHELEIQGTCTLQCDYKDRQQHCEFYVICTNTPAILGLESALKLGIVIRPKEGNVSTLMNKQNEIKRAEEIVEEYKDVFEGIGLLPGKHKIRIERDATPKVSPARKIPIGIQQQVKNELTRMEKQGIITKVDTPTDWVHPIVVVPKASGGVRICMDPRELNSVIRREHYKIPSAEDIFTKLEGATHFTVLDATSAFWQIELEEESSYLCTFATPWGRYRFLRLPYGIKSAPEVYQRNMDQLFQGIPGVMSYFDDMIVFGKGLREHNKRLSSALQRSREVNLKLQKKKLQLAVTEIDYLGHKITSEGLHIDPKKISAITSLSAPTGKSDLQRFLGMVNYLTKFIPNLASRTSYLRNLIRQNTVWIWDFQAQKDFEALKTAITNAPVLRFYDVKKPTTLSVDASGFGLGAVIMQNHVPVAYASVTLTETQSRYAQIEKELLAIVYGCEHFHFYIYGQETTVQTDHKPLLGIMKKSFDDVSPRIQRLLLRLQRYQIKLIYVPGKELKIADALSRDPQKNEFVNTDYLEEESKSVHLLSQVSSSRLEKLKVATKNDVILNQVLQYVRKGWPKRKNGTTENTRQYWGISNELHEIDGLLLKGKRIIIPESQRENTLQQIHSAHQGISTCKEKARQCVFWFGMAKEIEETVIRCKVCQGNARSNQKEPIMQYPIPKRPWERLGTDFMKLNGKTYILVIDYFSKYIEIQRLETTTATTVITALKSICGRHGIPDQIITDNGPPFNSVEFKDWVCLREIQHTTSSPYHPRSNGQVERAIQTIKNLLKKAIQDGQDPILALLEQRSSPQGDLPSPAEMLMGRKLRTRIPTSEFVLEPKFETTKMKIALEKRQEKQTEYANKGARMANPLEENQHIYLQSGPRKWVPGRIVSVGPEPRSYKVQTKEGTEYRRNRIHLRKAGTEMTNERGKVPRKNASPEREEKMEIIESDSEEEMSLPEEPTDKAEENEMHRSPRKTRTGRIVRTPARYKN